MTGNVLDLLDFNLKYFLQNKLKWSELTDIQEKTIPHILNNEDSLIIAPTASGKTESVLIPLYNQLISENLPKTSILYIAPLKALINDMYKRLFQWNNYFGFSATKWHGDVDKTVKNKFLRNPTDILLITPESLEVILINKSEIYKEKIFGNIKYVVIDEIHYFIESERGIQLNSLLKRLSEYSNDFIRIGLSATVGNEGRVAKWINHRKPANIIKTSNVHEIDFDVKNFNNNLEISEYLQEYVCNKVLFFALSRESVEDFNRLFKNSLKTNIYLHHSSIYKEIREKNEDEFKNISHAIMTSTNTLELGIDIGNIDVVAFNNPNSTMSSFIQKIGRSGRKSKHHKAILFCSDNVNALLYLAEISLAYQNNVENIYIRRKAFDIYLHQILSIVFQKAEVNIKEPFYILNDTYVFSKITKREYKNIINHLIEKNFLDRYNNKISLGSEFEKTFKLLNFYNFYSVFSTNTTYKIKYGLKDIGEIDLLYAYNLKMDMTFLLAGNYWEIKKLDHFSKIIYVKMGNKTDNIPKWVSATEKYSYLIMREVYKILLNNYDNNLLNLFDDSFINLLEYLNDYMKNHDLNECIVPVSSGNSTLTFYTFAGEKVNYLLLSLIMNNFLIKDSDFNSIFVKINIDGNNHEIIDYYNSLKKNIDDTINVYLDDIDNDGYQSKFGQYLPEEYQKEFIKELVFDFENLKDLVESTEAFEVMDFDYDSIKDMF